MNVTTYTHQALRREARRIVRNEADAARVKAKLVDWFLEVHNDKTRLFATGARKDGWRFQVSTLL